MFEFQDDVDEFDQLVADKTGLKEKLLVKKEGEKTKKSKDGYKQTKLDFKKKQTDPKGTYVKTQDMFHPCNICCGRSERISKKESKKKEIFD